MLDLIFKLGILIIILPLMAILLCLLVHMLWEEVTRDRRKAKMEKAMAEKIMAALDRGDFKVVQQIQGDGTVN